MPVNLGPLTITEPTLAQMYQILLGFLLKGD